MKKIPGVRLRIQCDKVLDHAKILPMGSFLDMTPLGEDKTEHEMKLYLARRIGEIICGNSAAYVYQPSDRSPIGRCAICGGALSFEIQEWDNGKLEQAGTKAVVRRPRRKAQKEATQ